MHNVNNHAALGNWQYYCNVFSINSLVFGLAFYMFALCFRENPSGPLTNVDSVQSDSVCTATRNGAFIYLR